MEPEKEYLVSLNVACKQPHELNRISEVLARAAAGLTLEGLTVSMNMTELEPLQEGVEEQQ